MTPQCPYCDKELEETCKVGLPVDYLFCHACKKAWTRAEWVDKQPSKENCAKLGLGVISFAELMKIIRHAQVDPVLGAYVPKLGAKEEG